MCKSCQYCFESCYWHLIEKRFCYDEDIALYEEPIKHQKLQKHNSFENMAFYDQVSLIAGRAIVTIDPLPKQAKPIEHQPTRRVRWWEDNVDEQNKENEAKNRLPPLHVIPIPTIMESSKEDLTSSMEELDSIIRHRVSINITDSKEENKNSEPNNSNKKEPENKNSQLDQQPAFDTNAAGMPKKSSSSTLLTVNDTVKMRKKSLRERRMSRSLTLNIDRNLELPVIRQISMPKFYIDTPEVNQLDSSVLMAPSITLTSPVMPRSSQFDFFDLRSVVQLEREHRAHHVHQPPVPVHKQLSPHSRLSQIKEKLKSTKLKRQGSATNLPNSIQHI